MTEKELEITTPTLSCSPLLFQVSTRSFFYLLHGRFSYFFCHPRNSQSIKSILGSFLKICFVALNGKSSLYQTKTSTKKTSKGAGRIFAALVSKTLKNEWTRGCFLSRSGKEGSIWFQLQQPFCQFQCCANIPTELSPLFLSVSSLSTTFPLCNI